MIEKQKQIYEGKAKKLFETSDDKILIQFFKDDATAFNAQKKAVINLKGILNNYISEYLMIKLTKNEIPNHFIKRINDREQLVKRVKIIPLEVIIRNVAAGSLAKRLKIEEGKELNNAVIEICYKNDELGDPLINDDHVVDVLNIVNKEQLNHIKNISLKINQILKKIFDDISIKLVDFKIEFGFECSSNSIILADEISPDSCRLWDKNSLKKFDKDLFRYDLGVLIEGYQEVAKRLGININNYNL